MKIFNNKSIIFLCTIVLLSGCNDINIGVSDKGEDTSSSLIDEDTLSSLIYSNTAGAEGFSIGVASSSLSSASNACGSLNKVVLTNNEPTVEPVFTGGDCQQVFAQELLNDYVVINGYFGNLSTDQNTGDQCSFVAVPLNSSNGTSVCLTVDQLTVYTQGWGRGMEAAVSNLYFADKDEQATRIKKWTGGNTTEVIFSSTEGEFKEIYTVDGHNFLFFKENAGIGLDGSYFYGNLLEGFIRVDSYRNEPIRRGNTLYLLPEGSMGGLHSYDLETGVYTDASISSLSSVCNAPNYGSSYKPLQMQWQSAGYTYWVDRDKFPNSLCRIDSNGIVQGLETTIAYQSGWEAGGTVILLGTSSGSPVATKLDLDTDTYSNTNILGELGLIEATSLAGYLDGIAISGTDSFGSLTTVYYNAITELVDAVPTDTSLISEVQYITP